MNFETDEDRFEKWWAKHSMIFTLSVEGDTLNCIRPSNDDEVLLAKAAARSAWMHHCMMRKFAVGDPWEFSRRP